MIIIVRSSNNNSSDNTGEVMLSEEYQRVLFFRPLDATDGKKGPMEKERTIKRLHEVLKYGNYGGRRRITIKYSYELIAMSLNNVGKCFKLDVTA